MRKIYILLTILWLIILTQCTESKKFNNNNLIKNGSFEEIVLGMPKYWDTWGWSTEKSFVRYESVKTGAQQGNNCICIENLQPNHAGFSQLVNVKENTDYLITAWVRTENVNGDRAGACIGISGKIETAGDLKGTHSDWQEVKLYVTTRKGINSLNLTLGLGNYGSMNSGKAYYDNISIKKTKKPLNISQYIILENNKNEKKYQKNENTARIKAVLFKFFLFSGIFIIIAIILIIYIIRFKPKKIEPPTQVEAENTEPESPEPSNDIFE